MKAISFFILLMASGVLFSCKKEFLNKGPEEDLTIEKVFSERRYAEAFLTSTYSHLPKQLFWAGLFQSNPFIAGTDEMDIPWLGDWPNMMNNGSWNAENVPDVWYYTYQGIRKTNIFLENVDVVPTDEGEISLWKGEAHFLRALYHFWLMKHYGAIPVQDKSVTPDQDFSMIRRTSLDSCVAFVVSECDQAIQLLPITVTQDLAGKATKAAALALKAKVLLHAASPLWNGNPDYKDLTDNQGVKLFPGSYDAGKWQKAADAAKACIDACEAGGYQLYRSPNNDPIKNYQELFLKNWNQEILYAYNYGKEGWVEKCSFPRSRAGWSGWSPTQEIVDDYEMDNGERPILGYNADGSPIINPASGYEETGYATTAGPGRWLAGVRNMYVHREPRFYATVNFSGAWFISRPIEMWAKGIDGKSGSGYATTGYLLRKGSDTTADIPANRFPIRTSIIFRLGEIYLDYAEALNEAQGPQADVYKYVNAIRNRVGLPALPAGFSQAQMQEHIRHERRIELSFETHRYFDTHRWKIAAQTEGITVHGMNVSAGENLQDNAFYQRVPVEKRVFTAPKHYLFPIPQSELNKNKNMIQNVGW